MRIMPGVRLTFSKRGISTSLGGRGATVNISNRGVRETVGFPGTGISYSHKVGGKAPRADVRLQPTAAQPTSQGRRRVRGRAGGRCADPDRHFQPA